MTWFDAANGQGSSVLDLHCIIKVIDQQNPNTDPILKIIDLIISFAFLFSTANFKYNLNSKF